MIGKADGKTCLVILGFLLWMVCAAGAEKIIYVDDDANGLNDGSSWADAYNYLQDALADANSGAKPVEVRVAQGTYKPDQGVGITPGNPDATLRLKDDVAIKGGYAGFGEPDPNERDFELYETILSGDLYGNDVDVNDPRDLLLHPSRLDNVAHVVTGSGTDDTAILDGFIITGGHFYAVPASGCSTSWGGGGMYNNYGSPTVMNCTFTGNCNIGGGGGMFNWDNSNPTLMNCTFAGNWAYFGGGMTNEDNSNPTLTNCTFSGNSAGYGGGMGNWNSSPALTNCILWANVDKDGMDESAQIHSGTPVVSYCCIQGWTGALGGTGNINADPLFVEATSGDYHLQSAGWRWHKQRKVWTWDGLTSPCIDAGNPGSDLRDELLSIPYDPDNEWGENVRINIGAFGGTAKASMAPRGWPVLADLSNDATVNFVDLALQAQDWLMDENGRPGDLNRDGAVGRVDLAIMAANWLKRKPFVVKITKPENGTHFYYYETIEIEADAWCFWCSVVKVEFFANGTKIGEDSHGSDGWKTNWEGDHAVGNYNLSAKATNDNEETTVSLAVVIRIGGGPP